MKVLIVDDDANIRLLIKMSLDALTKWQVLVAESGQQAIEIVGKDKPDLILLDRMMPEMDGIQTLLELRKTAEGANVPVIFLTAKVQQQEMEEYSQSGVKGIITKPFDPMTLHKKVQELMTRS